MGAKENASALPAREEGEKRKEKGSGELHHIGAAAGFV